jgi:anti-anti-sigma factor
MADTRAAQAARVVSDHAPTGIENHVTATVTQPELPDVPQPAALQLEVHRGEEVCVIRMQGSLVRSTSYASQELVDQLSSCSCRSVVFDASLLFEIDEVGVNILLGLQQYVASRNGKLIVYAATGDVARALDGSSIRQ